MTCIVCFEIWSRFIFTKAFVKMLLAFVSKEIMYFK